MNSSDTDEIAAIYRTEPTPLPDSAVRLLKRAESRGCTAGHLHILAAITRLSGTKHAAATLRAWLQEEG